MLVSAAVTAALLFCVWPSVFAQAAKKIEYKAGPDGYIITPNNGQCKQFAEKWQFAWSPNRHDEITATDILQKNVGQSGKSQNEGAVVDVPGFFAGTSSLKTYGQKTLWGRVKKGQMGEFSIDVGKSIEGQGVLDMVDAYDTTFLSFAIWSDGPQVKGTVASLINLVENGKSTQGKACLRLRNDPKRFIDFPDYYGRTALWYAAYKGNDHAVGLLLAKGAEIDFNKIISDVKIQVIQEKTKSGKLVNLPVPGWVDKATVQRFETRGDARLVFRKELREGITVLMAAAGNVKGKPTVVRYILYNPGNKDPQLFAKDIHGRTAFNYAVEAGYAEILKEMFKYCQENNLLDKCLNVKANNQSLLDQAVEKYNAEMSSNLSDGEKEKEIKRRGAVVQTIIDNKPQLLFETDAKGRMVFDKLVEGKRADKLDYSKYADSQYRDRQGNTLLMLAVQKADLGVLKAILKSQPDVLVVNKGISALHMAAADGKLDMLHTMLCKCGGSQCLQKSAVQGRTLKDELIGMAQSRGRQNVVAFLQNPNIVCPPPAAKVRR